MALSSFNMLRYYFAQRDSGFFAAFSNFALRAALQLLQQEQFPPQQDFPLLLSFQSFRTERNTTRAITTPTITVEIMPGIKILLSKVVIMLHE